MTDLVSIVMPAWNVAPFVAEAVESVRTQTWPLIELVAVDDGSTDGTGDILGALAARWTEDGRCMVVIRQANAGAAAARNAGLAAATGDVLAFMDGDDRWHPRLADALMATLAADRDADLTFPLLRYVDEAGRPLGVESRVEARRFAAADLLVSNPIHSATGVFVRRAAVEATGRFDETLGSCIDLDFFVRLGLVRQGNIVPTSAILADYRRRDGQITGDWRRMRENWRRVLDKSLEAGMDLPPRRLREARARWDLYCATLAYQAGDFAAARRLMAGVWRTSPFTAAGDAHARIRSLACLATLLPAPLHDRLRADVNALRRRRD
jgi:glycosyltransferase involved in cell wall biosynthesis